MADMSDHKSKTKNGILKRMKSFCSKSRFIAAAPEAVIKVPGKKQAAAAISQRISEFHPGPSGNKVCAQRAPWRGER